jgi:hypothetical protein
MDLQLAILLGLTFVIHLIGTLAYSVRIAGTRTGRIAVSFSLFNIFMLVSRVANSFQSPLLAKRVERSLLHGTAMRAEGDFRLLLLAGTVATVAGALLIPTFQRAFSHAVQRFGTVRSVPRLLQAAVSREGLGRLRGSLRVPSTENVKRLGDLHGLPVWVLALNAAAVALWTAGVLAPIYAGSLRPELRSTASNLSGTINGFATILFFVFIDPSLSVLTDDVAEGRIGDPLFRRCIVWLVGSRLAGTVLAQLILVPAAVVIARVADLL